METLTLTARPYKRKLIASDERQIDDLQKFVEMHAKWLESVFAEGKRHGIKFNPERLKESILSPETVFTSELKNTEFKTDHFLSMTKSHSRSLHRALPYLIINGDEVTVNQAELEKYFDENFRFYLSSDEEERDFRNTLEVGKFLTSARRFTRNKYAWLAIRKANPEVIEPLQNFLQ